jgi:hypothetical protein
VNQAPKDNIWYCLNNSVEFVCPPDKLCACQRTATPINNTPPPPPALLSLSLSPSLCAAVFEQAKQLARVFTSIWPVASNVSFCSQCHVGATRAKTQGRVLCVYSTGIIFFTETNTRSAKCETTKIQIEFDSLIEWNLIKKSLDSLTRWLNRD